jgi:hypothetical protein
VVGVEVAGREAVVLEADGAPLLEEFGGGDKRKVCPG